MTRSGTGRWLSAAVAVVIALAMGSMLLLQRTADAQSATAIELNFSGQNTFNTVGNDSGITPFISGGGQFTFDVVIRGAQDSVLGVGFDVTFDPAVLTPVGLPVIASADGTGFFLEGGTSTLGGAVNSLNNFGASAPTHDPANGVIATLLVISGGQKLSQPGPGLASPADGALARFTFNVAPGVSGTTNVGVQNFDISGGTFANPTDGTVGNTSDSGTVNVGVAPSGAADSAGPIGPSAVTSIAVLANDTLNVSGGLDTVTIAVNTTGTAGNPVVVDLNSALPTVNYMAPGVINSDSTTDTFTYTVTDSTGLTSAPITVTVQLDGQGPTGTTPANLLLVQNLFTPGNPINGVNASAVSPVDGRTIASLEGEINPADAHGPVTVTPPAQLQAPLGNSTLTFVLTDAVGNTTSINASVQVLAAADDTDGDGFSNGDEATIGTDPLDGCSPGGRPTDVNADGRVSLSDVLVMVGALSTVNARLDLDLSGTVNLVDILLVVGDLGTIDPLTCNP